MKWYKTSEPGPSDGGRSGFKLGTVSIIQLALLGVVVVLIGAASIMKVRQPEPAASADGFSDADRFAGNRRGGGGFGRGPGSESELAIVAQFDADGNERLSADERLAARAWLTTEGLIGGGDRGPGGGQGRRRGRSFAPASPGPEVSPFDAQVYASAPAYDLQAFRTFFLEFEEDEWEHELADFYNTDVEVPAMLMVDGRVFQNVGVGFRGSSSFRMVPDGSKRSLKVSLDYEDGTQQLAGYRTYNFLNAMNDPTFTRAMLYSHIARQYLPAPKINYAQVVINGESWGVYLSAEHFNSDFVRGVYGTTEGARWKVPGSPRGSGGMEYLGDDVDAYRTTYEIKSDDDPESWSDLIQLFRVLNQTPAADLPEAIEPILDVDGVLRFLAIEMALVNSDGYWTRASDYNLYQDTRGRFHVIPHDMNEALGVDGDVELDPLDGLDDTTKPLRSKLLAVPEYRERYLEYVREIADRWMDWERVGPLVRSYQNVIEDAVAADTRKLYPTEEFHQQLNGSGDSLKAFLDLRRAFLLRYEPV